MSDAKTKVLNVRLSAEVKARISADADEQAASFNDVGVGILADHFSVPFAGTGRRGPGTHTDEGPVLFRLPTRLWKKIHVAATDRPKAAVVEAVFRTHYALDADGLAAA